MMLKKNIEVASQLLAGLGGLREPTVIAAAFAENVDFEIPGDVGALPWIGRKVGRGVVESFIRDLRSLTEPVKFEVYDIRGCPLVRRK
jgi:hypothetical protein